jgi:hypothetical protein
MQKIIVLLSISILTVSRILLATEPMNDANSIEKIAHHLENLPSRSLINLTFQSKIDASLQPLLVKVPDSYTKTKLWPLLIVLHGLGDGPIIVPSINSMVQIGPFGRGDLWYRGLGEEDVFECINFARQIFNIDPDRIYLCGFSMGGAGTFDLGLKHPDIWAACVPVCGKLDNLELVENGINLAFWINSGSIDKVVPAEYSKKTYDKAIEFGFKHWKYTEHENMGHSFSIDWKKIEKWLLEQKRIQKPSNISFICENPSKAYWAEITEKSNNEKKAKIDAQITSQKINIRTSNISGYTIYLKNAPIELSKEIMIVENGNKIFHGRLAENGIFNRKPDCKKTDKIFVQ